jgi:hypothetical protein
MVESARFSCPSCGAPLKASSNRNRRVTCPRCGHRFEIGTDSSDRQKPGTQGVPNFKLADSDLSGARGAKPSRAHPLVWVAGALGGAVVVLGLVVIGFLSSGRAPLRAPSEEVAKTDNDAQRTHLGDPDAPPPASGNRRGGQTRSVSRPKRDLDVPSQQTGRKLAFLVGVKNYKHDELKNLDYPENDVKDLAEVLKPLGFAVTLMSTSAEQSNKEHYPDADNIRRQLAAVLEDVSKEDLILVGLAGHGLQPLNSSQSYFCPHDANPSEKDGDVAHPETVLSMGEILAQIRDSGIGHKLLLVDACRNDPEVRGGRRGAGSIQVDISALPQQTGVLLSCARGEFSFESNSFGGGHGAFFFQVIEGLKGAARDEDGEITWDSLQSYVRKHVRSSVQSVFGKQGGDQNPNAIGNLTGEPTLLARITVPPKTRSEPTRDGEPEAQRSAKADPDYDLAYKLYTGLGAPIDQKRAYGLFLKSAERGNVLAASFVWILQRNWDFRAPGQSRSGSLVRQSASAIVTNGGGRQCDGAGPDRCHVAGGNRGPAKSG